MSGMADEFRPGTVKPEAEYEELTALSTELGIPTIHCHYNYTVTSPDGEVVQVGEDRSRTFNRNWWNLFVRYAIGMKDTTGSTFGAGHLRLKDTSGTVHNQGMYQDGTWYALDYQAGAGTSGIWFGTGTAAEDFEGYALATRILNGTGAGELSYTAWEEVSDDGGYSPNYTYDTPTKTFYKTIGRRAVNSSGGSITINEVAMYYRHFSTATAIYIMPWRDKLPSGIAVANGDSIQFNYMFSMKMPA